MSTPEERRANGIQRIPVEALVEVCGVGGKQTPFEAESADVSGRGIRLRTAYLPEPGAPVVCRFESAGREVLAEGVVAWCQKETRGGEFGVKFTALDARSAETLRELCGIPQSEPDESKDSLQGTVASHKVASGAKVKLHIEGLGAPMRARVDEGKGNHISVGSSLEFLRIGRKLEMESVEDGSRREARIEGLDVMIDPGSGVPRLLVLLKTDGDEATPQPSVVETTSKKTNAAQAGANAKKPAKDRDACASPSAQSGQEAPSGDEPTQEQIDAMVGGVRRFASATRHRLALATSQLGSRLGPGVGRALAHVRQLSNRSAEPPRRKTTAAPSASQNPERKLRPQMRSVDSEAEASNPVRAIGKTRLRRVASAVVVAGILGSVVVIAAQGTTKSSNANAHDDALGPSASAVAVGNLTPGLPKEGASVNGAAQPLGADGGKLVVNVPLFGATTMATLERAPVASAAVEPAALVAAREQALAKATQAALAQGVDASKLSEEPTSEAVSDKSEDASVKPEDVAPFGHGRMKDPILYRLKLDAPGEALRGTTSSKGFTVMVPGRKLLESPSGFVKRDPRFSKISSTQSSDGAKIIWQFKEDAPAFRVRLRKSAVEILISEGKSSEGKASEKSK